MAAGVLLPLLLTVSVTAEVRGFLLGLLVLLGFGLWDDRSTLDYRVKFAGQVLAVGVAMLVGGALGLSGAVLQGALRYQACDANACMPPRKIPVAISLLAK